MRLFSLPRLTLVLLAAGALARCECEEPQTFTPGASYEPSTVLDFGLVSVTSERVLDVRVLSNGSAALKISQLSFSGADPAKLGKFLFEGQTCSPDAACTSLKQPLVDGLAPGRTSSITITYRPCPEAWNGNVLKEDFDFSRCPSAADQVDMSVIDNTREGSHLIVLSGQPAQAPVLELACPQGGGHCNEANPMLVTPCVALNFGNVTSGQMPCDIVVEVRNKLRDGKPPGTLNVDKLDILVQELNRPGIVRGEEVGFSLLDAAGTPLDVSAVTPFQVPFMPGGTQGVQRFKVRFDGTGYGIWRGEASRMTGLRLYSDDPNNQPFVTVSISATGSAPEIQCDPPRVDFGPVEQNTTKTTDVHCINAGDADLTISDIRFATDTTGQELSFTTDRGQAFPMTVPPFANNRFTITVSYTPRNSGQDSDTLRIGSNDTGSNPLEIPISGGAVPRIRCEPADSLVFALPNPRPPPPQPERCLPLTCSNIGYGDLTIQRVSLVGPEGLPDHPSVDDFSMRECPNGFPCEPQPAVVLCPPSNPACTNSSKEFTVCYLNNDNSTTDLADLKIDSTDLSNPSLTITLNAEDVPCLFPSPVITVETANPTTGMEVCVNGSASDPGGDPGMQPPTTINGYEWFWLFTPGARPVLNPPDQARTCFTPPTGAQGVYILGLHATNSCGRKSQTAAQETITVRPN
jgi:hypothetical protein